MKKEREKELSFDSRLYGGIIGFVLGDALGVPYEFKTREEVKDVDAMIGYGSHNQPPGTWSDDTSLTVCLIQNLIHGYDIEELKKSFCRWQYFGYWTHDGKLPFDIGGTTFRALSRIKAGIASEEAGETGEGSNGNGSLMRVLPLSYNLLHVSNNEKFQTIEEVSGITHAHIRSKMACSIYVEMGIQLLRGQEPDKAYEEMKKVILAHYQKQMGQRETECFARILKQNIALLPESEIKSSGYVIDSLESCLWSFLNSSSYEDAVWSAIRLGEDTDTIGALTGGLAGIYYGKSAIPSKWTKKIAKNKEIDELTKQFSFSLRQIDQT